MTRSLLAGACASVAILLAIVGANAQTQAPAASDQPAAGQGVTDQAASDEEKQGPIPFEGGQFTITQQEQYGEKVLAYDGKRLASNYDVFFEKIVEVGGIKVALFDVGDGGNQCGPASVIAWKPVVPGQEDRGRAPVRAAHDRVDHTGDVRLAAANRGRRCNGRRPAD